MLRFFPALMFLVAGNAIHAGDSADAFAGWSGFPSLNLSKLASGDVVTQTNTSMKFARGLSAQSTFIVNAPPEVAARVLLTSDPTKRADSEVYQHRSFQNERDAGFDQLRLDPKRGADQRLLTTLLKGGTLQLSKDERAKLPKNGRREDAEGFCARVLRARWKAAASEGDLGSVDGHDIRAEIAKLLAEERRIASHFASLLQPFTTTRPTPLSGEFYWDISKVNGIAALELGATRASVAGGRRQLIDVTFYASSGYLTSVTLHELVPITIDGRVRTLVWEGCLVSSIQLAGGFGVKRRIASVIMKSEIEQSVRLFQQEAARAAKD